MFIIKVPVWSTNCDCCHCWSLGGISIAPAVLRGHWQRLCRTDEKILW